MKKTRVFLVDDHAMLRSGIRLLVDGHSDMQVVGEAGTLQQAVETAPALSPDIVVLDLTMPGGSTGVSGVQRFLSAIPDVRILVLTMHDDPAYVRAALAMGASGYVVKSAADSELINAIREVASGRVYVGVQHAGEISNVLIPKVNSGSPIDLLSEREREVLSQVSLGFTNQQIADRFGLSVKTVESYRARLMQKLGLKDRADLMRLAIEVGLLKPPPPDQPPGRAADALDSATIRR